MGTHLVVVSAPSLAFSGSVVEAHEPVLVQTLRPELAVEGLDERPFDKLRTGLSVGLPGRLKSSVTLRVYAHRSRSRELNSLP